MFDRLVLNAVMLFLLFVGCAIYAPNASAQGSTIAGTGAVTGTVTAPQAVHGSAGLSAQRREAA